MAHGRPVSFGRYIFWGVISVLVAAFLAWAFVPNAVPVDVSTVEVGPMTVRVEGEGRTRVKDIYAISAPVAGRLMRIEAEAGDPVVAGQTRLAVIEPADPTILDSRTRAEAEATAQAAEETLALASADVERARAELGFARAELYRARKLSQNGTISQRALDVAKLEAATRAAEVKSAEATRKVREHELQTARARLLTPTSDGADGQCCVAIAAPIDGQVLRVLHESAGVVGAGEALMELGNPRHLEVVVDVLTSDAARIREGAEVVIENWGGQPLKGIVRRIEPFGYTKVSVLGIEEQRVDVIIDFADPAALPAALGHGFRVEVGINAWHGEGVLKAPMSALFRVEGGWGVFVMENGKARLARLEVGHMNGREAEVLGGLSAGEAVVLHPSDRISDQVSLVRREK
ncbi:efflux RND transporter periplasmic adaptor subunit [Magnetovibrio sp.]|uniref:efflux RND transporter periplasmic adaptor subunit n=1 Tax=Magnetovibrio sp. TaxID=2024836 RepID=UPI002F94509D